MKCKDNHTSTVELSIVKTPTMQFNDENDGFCRQLTFTDVDQALYALQINPVLAEKHSNSTFSSEPSTTLDKQEGGPY